MSFVAVWFIINLIVGFGSEQVAGAGQAIAWQAHIGGFLFGILCFAFFERGRMSARY